MRRIPVACEKTSLKTVEKVEEKTAVVPASSLDGVERIGEPGMYAGASGAQVGLENESESESEKVGL